MSERTSIIASISPSSVRGLRSEYSVYDRDFRSISHWCAPGYDMDGCDMYVLNNNNVLVQYKVILDNDAEKFDYVINNDDYLNLKIDLATFMPAPVSSLITTPRMSISPIQARCSPSVTHPKAI